MLRSMTGFGRGITKSGFGTISTEIKTVNHRYLDIIIRLPKELQALDAKIKDCIKKTIHRGRVEITIERRGSDHSISAEVNLPLARTYLTNLRELQKQLNLKDTPSLFLLSQLPGVVELKTSPLSTEKIWTETRESIDKALSALLKMREREGKFIEKDIKTGLKTIRKRQEDIEKRMPVLLNKYREELKRAAGEPSGEMNNEKIDISEELSRFSSHLEQVNIFLREKADAGRKINFTIQEMTREVNTMAAKTNDFPVSRAVVIIKTELEKIKEQIQNIE